MTWRAGIVALIAAFAAAASAAPHDRPGLTLDAWLLQHPAATAFGSETFAAQGQPTDAAGWLGMLVAGGLYAASPFALSAANALFAAIALGWLAAICSRAARPAIVVVVVGLCGLATQGGWASGTLGLELIAASAFCGALRARRIPLIYAAIPAAAIWCSFSPSGLIAPILALAATTGAIVDERGATPRLRALAIASLATLFATLCTPGGIGFAANALTHLGIFEASVEAFVSWDPSTRPVALLAGFVPLMVLCAWVGTKNGGGWMGAAFAACAILLGLCSAPLLPIAAFAIAPVIASALESAFHAFLDEAGERGTSLAAAALAVGFIVLAGYSAYRAPRGDRGAGAAVATARSAGAGRFFCAVPSWCDYAVAGGARVFMDGRIASYPAGRRDDAVQVARTEKDWRRVLARWKVDAVVVPRDRPLAQLLTLDSKWRRLPDSDDAAVFVRSV
jgi:hypothetical protein